MVDEVNIKIKADASEAKSSMRDLKFYLTALREDTKLLNELQEEYNTELKKSSGVLTPKAKNTYSAIRRLTSAIREDEGFIAKARDKEAKDAKEEAKNKKKTEKSTKTTAKVLKGLARVGIATATVGAVKKAIDIAQKGREDLLLSQKIGISGGAFEAMSSGFAALGVNARDVGDILLRLGDAISGAKTGMGLDEKTLAGLSMIGITNPLQKNPQQILTEMARYASMNRSKDTAYMYRQMFGIDQALFNELAKGEKYILDVIEKAPKELMSLTDRELEEQRKTANAWSEATTKLTNAISSLTTGDFGEWIREIAHHIGNIANWIKYKFGSDEELRRLENMQAERMSDIGIARTNKGREVNRQTASRIRQNWERQKGRPLTASEMALLYDPQMTLGLNSALWALQESERYSMLAKRERAFGYTNEANKLEAESKRYQQLYEDRIAKSKYYNVYKKQEGGIFSDFIKRKGANSLFSGFESNTPLTMTDISKINLPTGGTIVFHNEQIEVNTNAYGVENGEQAGAIVAGKMEDTINTDTANSM